MSSLHCVCRDSDAAVVLTSLPPLSSLLSLHSLPWEDRESCSRELTSLLTDTREQVVLETLAQVWFYRLSTIIQAQP